MKPIFAILFASALVAPLSAQDPQPGNDLVDLFEKSQREGATDEELMRMLEDKAMAELNKELSRERPPQADPPRGEAGGKDAVRPPAEAAPAKPAPPGRTDAPRRDPLFPRPGFGPQRWLVGVIVSPLDPSVRAHFDLKDGTGVVVESVMQGSPAAEAGLKVRDIITNADGRKVSSLEDLQASVQKAGEAGKSLNVGIIRRGEESVVKIAPRFAGRQPDAAKPDEPSRPDRPMNELKRRLDQQQKEIEALRREIRELRARLDQR